jgi:hypothetical protein
MGGGQASPLLLSITHLLPENSLSLNPSAVGYDGFQRAHQQESADLPPTSSRVGRKIALLKRFGLFADATPGVEIVRACSVEDLRAAYALVHEIFVERGYCKPKEYGMRLRVFEATAGMATFIAKSKNRVVGVLSVVEHTPDCGLPSERAFKPELDALRSQYREDTFCEWSNQVVASDFRKTNVSTELMRCAAAHVIKAGYDHSIISVSAVHGGFYELLGFKQIGPKRSYSKEIDDPVVAFHLPSTLYLAPNGQEDELAGFVRCFMATENPYLSKVETWATKARMLFTDSASLQKLFGRNSNFLRSCELDAQTALVHQWGPQIFTRVVGSTLPSCIFAWASTVYDVIASTVGTQFGKLSPALRKLSQKNSYTTT